MSAVTAADALVRVLEEEGVEYVFGIPGAHILPFFDALTRSTRIKTVLTKHEGGAAYMAKAYIRASGKPAVCVATAGPGATNLVTGVAEAFCENIPLIVITGQVAANIFGLNAAQEATGEYGTPDQVALLKETTRASTLVFRSDRVVPKTREAFRMAWTEPHAPVHLSFPSDVLSQPVELDQIRPENYRVLKPELVDQGAVEKAAEFVSRSHRPVMVVGHRAVFPDASKEVVELAERFGIPVVTTVVAKGIISEDHPLSLGVLHLFGHKAPDRYLKQSDCIVTVGEAFSEYATNYFEPDLVPPGTLVQIDCDLQQMGRIYPMALGVPGSIKASLKALARALQARGAGTFSKVDELDELRQSTKHFAEETAADDSVPMKPQRFFAELASWLPDDVLVQLDIGQNFFWTLRYLKAKQGRCFGTWGFEPMGVGVAGAIGLSLAHPGRRIVCICGDGAMQMHGNELATAVNYGLPVTWVVFNDNRLSMVRFAQGMSYGERYICTEMRNPDFGSLARAFGVVGITVERAQDLAGALEEASLSGEPAVIDVKVDGDELLPLKPRLLLLGKKMGLDVQDSSIAGKAFRKILDER